MKTRIVDVDFSYIIKIHQKRTKDLIIKSIKELLSFVEKNIQKEYKDDKLNIKLDLWSSGDPTHQLERNFQTNLYKFWTGKKGEMLTEENIKDKISNVNIEGISKDNIFIEYIAYSKQKIPFLDDQTISCTKKEKALRMTIIPYLRPFATNMVNLNKDNLIPSKTTHSKQKKFLEHWEEFKIKYK